jgi:hypothetical protein
MVGADLNRNFDVSFGNTDPDPCIQHYGGNEPFSEPETRAFRDFINNHKDITMNFNLHSYGGFLVKPFNSDKTGKKLSKHLYNGIYDDIRTMVKNYTAYGLCVELLGYTANGSLDDWLLHEHNIIAVTAELALPEEKGTLTFFPEAKFRRAVIERHLPYMLTMIEYVDSG